MLRLDELDAWLPTIFTKKTWDRRSNTEAAVKARARTIKARAKARIKTKTDEVRAD